jgi:ribosome recycling factor
MGLNPSVEGGTVLATIPKPSAETRENFVKVAGKAAEKVPASA